MILSEKLKISSVHKSPEWNMNLTPLKWPDLWFGNKIEGVWYINTHTQQWYKYVSYIIYNVYTTCTE